MTIIEKIFSRASGRPVKPGDLIWAELDLVAMRDFGGPNVVGEYRDNFGASPVFDPGRVAITFDLHVPARDEKVARNQLLLREFARAQGVRLFDVNTGVGQHILFENGLVKPGDIIVGTDSHMNLLGALGAAGFGMGTTDIAAGMYGGRLWFKVPATVRILIRGRLGECVTAKDAILFVVKKLGTDGALGRALEFTGPLVDSLSLAQRITLCSMVTEMSGDIGFIEPSAALLKFIRERARGSIDAVRADPDAGCERTVEFDVEGLGPLVACPHSPDNVKPVAEVAGIKIDQVFIGSCTNGRLEDLQLAARILRNKRVKNGLRLIIVPATMEVAREALKAGLYDVFLECGAVVANPGCALCTTGHPGILAPGESMVSTSNRNFVGKLGRGADVYLASPAVAAATALTGSITDPRSIE
jgi:3-isopropylmalate/(R)-2-methylmalate dehydratase large subunit